MKFRLACAVASMVALAACGGGGGTTTNDTSVNASAAAPVAAPAGQNWAETVSRTAEGGYRIGNPDASIKLIEFGSRTCPTCGAFGREGNQPLIANYVSTGKVNFEFRDYLVHGAPDIAAALLGQCGGPQPFFPILEQMYQNQSDYLDRLQKISPAVQTELSTATPTVVATRLAEQMNLIEFVKQRGIPEAKARACLTDQTALETLAKLTDAATASGVVTGTPTFLLNGNKIDALNWSQIEEALKAAGA